MTLSTDKTSYVPSEDIVCTIGSHSETPNAATINGVTATIQAGASSSSATVTAPAPSDFEFGASHEATRMAQDLDLVLSFPTESDETDTIQIEADDFYTATGSPEGSSHESSSDVGDEYYWRVTSGVGTVDTDGVWIVTGYPLVAERRWFDVSLGLWSAKDTVTLTFQPRTSDVPFQPSQGGRPGVYEVVTTDDTTTTVFQRVIPEGQSGLLEIVANGQERDAASPEYAIYKIEAGFYRGVGGSATFVGTDPTTNKSEQSAGSPSVAVDFYTTNTLEVRVTGVNATMDWRLNIQISDAR